MNWILALFGFAGIMAIMSIIASVVVEAIHKVFSLRGSGLKEMLRALHDGVVMPLDPAFPEVQEGLEGGGTKEASKFAKQMMVSPSYGGKGRWWWISNLPGLNLFRRKYENLSKIQFVEQLTQTDYGKRLSGKDRSEIKTSLNRLVYEFDRYGEGQSNFFRGRAKVFTTIVALLIVSLGNLNALSIYRHLASDEGALNGVISFFQNDPELLNAYIDKRTSTLAAIDPQDAAETQITQAASTIKSDIRILSNAGFPVGRAYFPYCEVPSNPGCDVKTYKSGEPVNLLGYKSYAIPRIFTPEGATWFLGMIATAGLIGLGAPFWYNIFKLLATMAVRVHPVARQATAVMDVSQTSKVEGEVKRPPSPKGTLASPGEEPDLDLLTDAFLTVSGKDVLSRPPMGKRLGEASADRVSGRSVVSVGLTPAVGETPLNGTRKLHTRGT